MRFPEREIHQRGGGARFLMNNGFMDFRTQRGVLLSLCGVVFVCVWLIEFFQPICAPGQESDNVFFIYINLYPNSIQM